MRWIPIGEFRGFDLDRLTHYELVPSLPRTSRGTRLQLWLDGSVGVVTVVGELAETVFAFLRSLSDPHAKDSLFPARGSFEDAEFGVSRPRAEPGPPLEEASYSPTLSEIDDAS